MYKTLGVILATSIVLGGCATSNSAKTGGIERHTRLSDGTYRTTTYESVDELMNSSENDIKLIRKRLKSGSLNFMIDNGESVAMETGDDDSIKILLTRPDGQFFSVHDVKPYGELSKPEEHVAYGDETGIEDFMSGDKVREEGGFDVLLEELYAEAAIHIKVTKK